MRKTFLSSISSFTLALLAIALSQAFSSLPVASAVETWPPEIPLVGHTTAVMVNGVNNSGIINFDEPGVDAQYRARFFRTAAPFVDGQEVYELKGWGWNDNLGWVSFYCDGTNGQPIKQGSNLGGQCGTQTYGVKLIKRTVNGQVYFSMKGHAWNDATGYISMGKRYNDPPETADYGVGMEADGTFVSDYASVSAPYAHSASLEWIDFSGVYGNADVERECPDPQLVCPCLVINPEDVCDDDDDGGDTTGLVNISGTPVADGVDGYKIKLSFKKADGTPVAKATLVNNYDIRILLKWTDTVKQDQVYGSPVGSDLTWLKEPFSDGDKGAVVYKPVFIYNETASWDGITGAPDFPVTVDLDTNSNLLTADGVADKIEWDSNDDLILNIKSLAPTSGANKSKVLSLEPKDVYKDNDAGAEKNNLNLEWMRLIIVDPDGRRVRTMANFRSKTLDFKPAIYVDTLKTQPTGGTTPTEDQKAAQDMLMLYRNIPSTLNVQAKRNSNNSTYVNTDLLTTKIGFLSPVASTFKIEYKWGPTTSTDPYSTTPPAATQFLDWASARLLQVRASIADEETKAADYADGITIRSTAQYQALEPVNFSPRQIKYYSNFLPRIPSKIANPVAVIQGPIYGTGTTTQEGITLNQIGDNNTNIVKDTIFENIKKLVRDKNITWLDGTVEIKDLLACPSNCTTIQNKNGSTVLETILYIKAKNVVISNIPHGNLSGNYVIVVDGGNLFINTDLYDTDKKTSSFRLGLVAIRNSEKPGEAGNMYIHNDVKNIQAFAVLWGVIFSYNGSQTPDSTTGIVTWTDDAMMMDTLKKQLLWEGGLSSLNTIGGTDTGSATYYKTPFGILKNKTEDNFKTARLYDLNYLRYFRKKIIYNLEGEALDTSCGEYLPEEEWSAPINPACDGITAEDITIELNDKALDTNEVTETNPLYIKYVPPYSKSVIFGKEKTLTF